VSSSEVEVDGVEPAGSGIPGAEHQLPLLEVDRLTVEYGAGRFKRRKARSAGVTDVSFSVRAGESVALIGESGSGKTTTALAVAGVGRIDQGEIRVLDEVLDHERPRYKRRRADVQMILQDPYSSFDPRQSVRSGIRELKRLHGERTAWTTDEDLLASVALNPRLLDRRPHELSGGQLQRVGIARALLLRPKLLIADEPTSALDVAVQAQILQLLLTLHREQGISLLFVTHDLAIVNAVANRVVVLQQGQVVEQGQTSKVLMSPEHPYTAQLLDALPGKTLARCLTPGSEPIAASPHVR
jgi:peptide/nickel transport system ATP-binding protein